MPRALQRPRAACARVLARRRVRIALVCALVAIPLLTCGWLWFRKSGLVAVEKVRISGVSGAQGHAIEAALRQAAHGMSTLDLDTGALRAAVAQFAIVRGLHTSTHFPHTLVIAVTERPAAAALVIGNVRTAVAADGFVLGPAVLTSGLPSVSARWQPQPGQSVHEGGVLAELAVIGAAPKALAARVSSAYTGAHGLTVAMRNGLLVYFGDAERAHAKWLALERVLLDEGSVGAGYIDVRLPERPAAGGFPEGVPPPVSSQAGTEATSTDPATEASVAALAEGLRGELTRRRLRPAGRRQRTRRRQPFDIRLRRTAGERRPRRTGRAGEHRRHVRQRRERGILRLRGSLRSVRRGGCRGRARRLARGPLEGAGRRRPDNPAHA